jgi:hypothetical protein
MNPSDLLYTNSFVNTNPLTQREVQKNANEYIPYRNLKGETVNNVRDELERTGFTDNSMNRVAKEANPWSRGYYGNQQPMLSEFGKDIAENSYFKYRSNYINIDSRMRDVALYPTPNNYSVFLGKKFNNVETVKLIDYFFPEMEYPINSTNNVILWYPAPFETFEPVFGLTNVYNPFIGSPYDEYRLNICGWYINFSRLIQTDTKIEDYRFLYNNNLLSCLNKIEIPPGFYTTEQLSQTIREEFQKTTFFNSNIYNKSYKEYSGNAGSPTFKFKDFPQLVDVQINPETSNVRLLLRYEEFHAESIATYRNKNYFDIEMKVIDNSIPSPEFLELIQNDVYPIVITGFPEIGGYTGDNVNYIEFVPKNKLIVFQNYYGPFFYKTYYDKITNGDGNVIPNVLRFYIYNLGIYKNPVEKIVSTPIKSSYTEIIKQNNIKFGREAPFFLINGSKSLFSNYISYIQNNISNISNIYSEYCEDEKNDCTVISSIEENIYNNLIVNLDCSSRLLTNMLGFLNTNNSLALVGPEQVTFGINTNNIFEPNKYINYVQTYNIDINEFRNYSECAGLNPPNDLNYCRSSYISWNEYYPDFNSNYRLPVSRNQNGTYSFYLNNYFFMKILSSSVGTQIQTSSTITQIKSTANFANGSSDIYEINDGINNGSKRYLVSNSFFADITPIIPPDPKCKQFNFRDSKSSKVTKNLNNIFAKIKYSSVSGNYEVDNRFVNELIFESNTINNLDEFVIQLVDYEGKILPQVKEHNFTLLIVEKYEVLKETNINSRNNNVNIGGIKPVERNSFSNS